MNRCSHSVRSSQAASIPSPGAGARRILSRPSFRDLVIELLGRLPDRPDEEQALIRPFLDGVAIQAFHDLDDVAEAQLFALPQGGLRDRYLVAGLADQVPPMS